MAARSLRAKPPGVLHSLLLSSAISVGAARVPTPRMLFKPAVPWSAQPRRRPSLASLAAREEDEPEAIIRSMHALLGEHARGPPLGAGELHDRLASLTARAAAAADDASSIANAAAAVRVDSLKVSELRRELQYRRAATTGKKAELQTRLASVLALEAEGVAATPSASVPNGGGAAAQDCSATGAAAPARRERAISQTANGQLQALARSRAGEGPQTGIFTDGSCNPNPGPGGWGAVCVRSGAVLWQTCGGEAVATNNRMELLAIIVALHRLPEGDSSEVIYSDSQLCVRTLNEWATGWKARGWTKADGKAIKNVDLVQEAHALVLARPGVGIRWLKGHAGSTWNEYADALADIGRAA